MKSSTVILFIFFYLNNVINWNLKVSGSLSSNSEISSLFDSYNNITDLEDYPNVCDNYGDEACAKLWIEKTDPFLKRNSNRLSNINYQYSTNINEANEKIDLKFQHQQVKLIKKLKQKAIKFQWKKFENPLVNRAFRLLTPTIESKNNDIKRELLNISSEISKIYNSAKPCFVSCLHEGESGIVNYFATERNYEMLVQFWSSWRDETGRKIRNLFIRRMNLENIGAKENGYADAVSFQLKNDFEDDYFDKTVIHLYNEIEPLYKQLHGYVRYCLAKFYPNKFDKTGPIPSHIFGNVWAQQWTNIMDIIKICRSNNNVSNISDEANKKLKTISVHKMFEIAEEFYESIGLKKMTKQFWERSMLTKPYGKLVDCHGSAHDFSNGHDYRITMCTDPNINDFTTIHHEMGHIEYYMAYGQLPYIFQGSANPGFHEAIGDTIALSVKTPEHLKKIGFINSVPTTNDFDVEYLLEVALEKISFLPFALTMDSYLWSVYNQSVPLQELNKHWWDLTYRFQGLKPPIQRTELDFDPGAKYHIAFGISYIRYFISFIIQFQFYESMCKLANYSGPLHRCDFYQSKSAGKEMLNMLEQGKTKNWRETLYTFTGQSDISSSSLLSYFSPLMKWLTETNKELNVPIGW